jgi:hypothetical protein
MLNQQKNIYIKPLTIDSYPILIPSLEPRKLNKGRFYSLKIKLFESAS